MTSCLEGIKVLDLTRYAPGPFCTMVIADLGADVLKIEEPGKAGGRRDEQGRGAASNPADRLKTWPFNPLNRNKRSLALNLKTEVGRRIFYKLAKGSDVVVEEFRPGVSQRLGIDYATLKSLNPRIVYCAITGYGQDGPHANQAGHDINYISAAGVLGLIGPRSATPAIPFNLIGDYAGGGMNGVIGILASLLARDKTGRGQFVDVSMTDGAVSLLGLILWEYLVTGQAPKRGESLLSGGAPQYNVYETKDGKYVSLGCLEPWFYANLCRAMGREDFIPFGDDEGEKRQEIFAFFRQAFLNKTRDEWFDMLSKHDLCVSKVLDLDEIATDPQLIARQMVVETSEAKASKVKQIGIAIKLSETPGQIKTLAPTTGQHSKEVLSELGYGPDDIEAFRRDGIIA